MTRWLPLVVALAACGKSAQPPPVVPDDIVVFGDVTVVPMDRPGVLEHHTVVVQGGRITAMGPFDSTRIPDGARLIDARGKWLIPGLADMHVHTFDPQQLALLVSMGVTTIRVLWGDPATIGARDAIARGDNRIAPSIYTAGEIIDGKPAVWPGSSAVGSVAEAIAEVERQKRVGYDYVKVYSLLPQDSYAAIVKTAGKLGMPVIGHVPFASGLGTVLDAKQRSIEHLEGYARYAERDDSPLKDARGFKARMGAYKYADEAKLADAVARTKKAGTWNCPTLVVLDWISKLDKPDARRPEYRYVSRTQIEGWDPKKDFRFQTNTADDFATMRGMVAWSMTVVKQLADAGAPILAGTDVGNPWLVPGFSLHQELELLVAAKLTPFQALQAATVNAADFANARGEFGTIAVGRRGDLVLLHGDPLAKIENTQRIGGVLLRGRWFSASDLEALRDTIAAIHRGDRSRFEGVAVALPDPVFTARYRVSGPFASGEERVTATATTLVGEMRLENAGPSRWQLELGAGGLGDKLHVIEEGLDLVMVRDGARVKVTGNVGANQVAIDDAIAADELLGGAALGVDLAFERTLTKLAVGATRSIKLAVLEVRPLAIRHATIVATRLPDATRTVAGKPLAVTVYKLEIDNRSSELALDASGWTVDTATHTRL